MFGLKPLLGLEPMAPIRPQLLVSHANHSATETSICMYICPYVCMYVCIYVCRCVYVFICMHVCTRVCMYACMYVRVCLCMTIFMYCLYVGFDYTCRDIKARTQEIKSFFTSYV